MIGASIYYKRKLKAYLQKRTPLPEFNQTVLAGGFAYSVSVTGTGYVAFDYPFPVYVPNPATMIVLMGGVFFQQIDFDLSALGVPVLIGNEPGEDGVLSVFTNGIINL